MGVLEHLQAEIEKRSLSSSGWASGNSRRAGIETTSYALMALHDRRSIARDRGIDLLFRTQNADGSWPAFVGDASKPTSEESQKQKASRRTGSASRPGDGG